MKAVVVMSSSAGSLLRGARSVKISARGQLVMDRDWVLG